MPESAAAYDGWSEAVAALESLNTEATNLDSIMDVAAHVAWTPPTNLGPLPLHLRERADRLLREQRESIRNLEELYRETGRHLAAVRAVPRMSEGQSVYLDVVG